MTLVKVGCRFRTVRERSPEGRGMTGCAAAGVKWRVMRRRLQRVVGGIENSDLQFRLKLVGGWSLFVDDHP